MMKMAQWYNEPHDSWCITIYDQTEIPFYKSKVVICKTQLHTYLYSMRCLVSTTREDKLHKWLTLQYIYGEPEKVKTSPNLNSLTAFSRNLLQLGCDNYQQFIALL